MNARAPHGWLEGLPALPVLTLSSAEAAARLGQVLCKAGLRVVEVTLRTPAALDCIRAMREAAGELVVGAGTVLGPADLDAAQRAGAAFAVSPGTTPTLYRAASDSRMPLLPGVATASEIALGLEFGWRLFKFFPAEAAGGPAALKAWAGPFPGVRFCPTGGIGLSNAADYLRLDNVTTVGGSWMAPTEAVSAGEWSRIDALARETVERLGSHRLFD